MKKILLLLIIATTVLSCTPKLYTYSYQMIEPAQNESLTYENDSIKIKFTIDPKFILFRIDNKLNEGIKINWDETSFSINGKTYRTVHKETNTMKTTEVQPVTTIPPHSYLVDGLIPVDKVKNIRSWSTGNTVPIIFETFPSRKNGYTATQNLVNSLRGSKIRVYIPMYIRGEFISKYYEILIKDIK